MTKETVEQFLARGGTITVLPDNFSGMAQIKLTKNRGTSPVYSDPEEAKRQVRRKIDKGIKK
jgi:hypothetical protein